MAPVETHICARCGSRTHIKPHTTHTCVCSPQPPEYMPKKPGYLFYGGFTGERIFFFLFIFSNTSINDMYYLHNFLIFMKRAFLINTTKLAINKQLAKITTC